MIYRKNIHSWEQVLRIAIGLGLAGYAAIALAPGLYCYGLIATGLFVAVTGVFGWCPACAMVGRRLNKAK